MSKIETAMQKVRDYSPLILQLVGILVIVANLWIVSKLAPIEQNLTVMANEIVNIKEKVDSIEEQHNSFVRDETFDLLVNRIDHISSRVDAIYSLVAK